MLCFNLLNMLSEKWKSWEQDTCTNILKKASEEMSKNNIARGT